MLVVFTYLLIAVLQYLLESKERCLQHIIIKVHSTGVEIELYDEIQRNN